MPRTALLLITLGAAACNASAQRCLQTPISNKIPRASVKACAEALEWGPDRQDLFHQYMGLCRVQGNYAEMVRWSRRVLNKNPLRTDAIYSLAYGLRKAGHCKEALVHYTSYAAINKDDPDPFYGMALCYEALNQQPQAIQAYQLYVQKEKRSSQQAWVARASARLAVLGQPSGGLPAGGLPAGGLPVPSQPAGGQTAAGVMPPPVSPSPDCSTHERAIQKNPFDTDAYDRFAQCSARNGRHDLILRRMRIALRDNPGYARAWLHMGRALQAKGNLDEAKRTLARACKAGVTEACSK